MSKTEMTLNPKFTDMELGKSFSGTCIRCNKEEDKVRILLNQSDEKSGPYDRLCAYELKMGSVPPFTTFPRNLKEKIYRFTTKSEIPSDDKIINRAFVRILIILGLELIGYLLLPGSLLLVMIELFTNLKLIRISSPFVITILLLNVISMVYITLQISEIQLDHPDKSGIRKRIDKIEQIPKKIDNNLYENVTWKEFFKTSFIYFFYLIFHQVLFYLAVESQSHLLYLFFI